MLEGGEYKVQCNRLRPGPLNSLKKQPRRGSGGAA